MPDRNLENAAAATPDPERSLKNLQTFCEKNPDYIEKLESGIRPVSLLFSISQFLANFSCANPEALFEALRNVHKPFDKEILRISLNKAFKELPFPSREAFMSIFRQIKKKKLMHIVLRDLLDIADITDILSDLSGLADVLVEEALHILQKEMNEIYGRPDKDAFVVIAVGKLGSNELNFSSDIDLIYVYETEQGETSGIVTPQGLVINRISNHEYYCKLGETLSRFLSLNTEDGFVYRVDLRLRPEGQKGSITMSLPAYELYYESWGRAWERAVFLRARPIAGDRKLGKSFMNMIIHFVYRKYLDFNSIDEIRNMKTKINERVKKNDIKQGFGGIREIEFFVHALQLIYGGSEPVLREMSILRGLHMLLQKNIIGHKDYMVLSDNYMFLRKLENRLQQLNDLQTHSLPSDEKELNALGKKMGMHDKESFLSELESRRKAVRHIYDSLFTGGRPDAEPVENGIVLFFGEETTDDELKDYLKEYRIMDIEKAIRNIQQIRNTIREFQTLRSRRLLDNILSSFLYETLKSNNPDRALNNLQPFAALLSYEEPYLELFAENKKIIPALVSVFSESDYLSKAIMKRTEYLEMLGQKLFLRHTLFSIKKELAGMSASGRSVSDAVRIVKQMEEIRLGILFLDKKIDIIKLIKGLSRAADAVIYACTEELFKNDLAVIGLGKAGGRELTFASDLDLIFVCKNRVTEGHVRAAERFIRLLASYTKDGMAYKIDTRLRPEGTRGLLVSSINSLRDYYMKGADPWEFQALLKARPISGDMDSGCCFMELQKDILLAKGREVTADSIRNLRKRILSELSREAEGYDIKLGKGGLEELEFTVQYLQLANLHRYRRLIIQGTIEAIKRLGAFGLIGTKDAVFMKETYVFYRTIEGFMRLADESVLRENSASAAAASGFMGFNDIASFIKNLKERRAAIHKLSETYLC